MITWNKIPKPVRVILIIIIIGLLLVFGSWVYRKLRAPVNAAYIQGGDKIPEGWTPNDVAKKMFDAIDGFFVLANTKNNAAQKIAELNDNQIISVYNYWNEKYATKSAMMGIGMFGTLTQAMKDEWDVPAIGTGINYWDALLLRLGELKLP